MLKIKKLLALALALAAASFPQALFAEKIGGLAAEARAQAAIDGSDVQDRLPEVTVSEVFLDKTAFAQGETVSGSALLSNAGSYPARVVLNPSILEGEGDNETVVSFGANSEPIELLPGEERTTLFSVTPPVGRSIRAARVEATVRLDGSALLSWDYSDRFNIEGDGRYTYISFASFEGDVPTVSGPFLYDGGSLDLQVEISSGVALSAVAPVLDLKNRATDDGALFRGEPVAAGAGSFTSADLTIARGNLVPGVYEGDLSLESSGRPISGPSVPVRVVVAGESATVHSVRSTASSVSAGDVFDVILALSGSPIDPTKEDFGSEARAWNGTIKVDVLDFKGNPVSSGEWRGKIADEVEVPISLTAEEDAEAMVATVSVFDSRGRTVFSREFQLGQDAGAAAAPGDVKEEESSASLTVSLVAVIALLAILLALLVRRRRAAAATILSCGLIAAALAGSFGATPVAAIPPSLVSCATDPGCWIGQNEWDEILAKKDGLNQWHKLYEKLATSCEVCDKPLASDTNLLDDTGKLPTTVDATSVNISLFGPDGKKINIAKKEWPKCGDVLKIEARATFLACENTGIVGKMTSQLYRISGPGGVEVEAITPPESEDIRKPSFGSAHGFYSFTYRVEYTSDRLTRNGWYRVYVRASSWDGVSAVTGGKNDHVDFYMGDCDKCANFVGDQNVVPAGMTRNTGGDCVCAAGWTYDPTDGRCEDSGGNSGCPVGQKYCDGVCIPESAACSTVVADTCPLVANGEQYCVEIFDRSGVRTNQMAAYGADELEKIFGFGIREARYEQVDDIAAGGTAEPVWGVVGRAASLAGVSANEGSAGCGGIMCAYNNQGCLTTADEETNQPVGNCSPINDLAGPAGMAPDAVINVEPSVIGRGGRCRVYWGSHEMKTCQVSGPGVSSAALAGTATGSPISMSAAYTLSCVGADGGTYTDSDTCMVDPDVAEF